MAFGIGFEADKPSQEKKKQPGIFDLRFHAESESLTSWFVYFCALIWFPYMISSIIINHASPSPDKRISTLFSQRIQAEFDARERRASHPPNLNNLNNSNGRREFSTMSKLARPVRTARAAAPPRPAPLPAMNWGRIWRAGTRVVRR